MSTATTVSVSVVNGPSFTVPWVSGMTAHQALEAAYNQNGDAATFTFGIQYYGAFGYLVFMIDQTCDTWNAGSQPYYYWEFLLNGVAAAQGIDSTVLQPGDAVGFQFTTYTGGQQKHPQLFAKHRRSACRVA